MKRVAEMIDRRNSKIGQEVPLLVARGSTSPRCESVEVAAMIFASEAAGAGPSPDRPRRRAERTGSKHFGRQSPPAGCRRRFAKVIRQVLRMQGAGQAIGQGSPWRGAGDESVAIADAQIAVDRPRRGGWRYQSDHGVSGTRCWLRMFQEGLDPPRGAGDGADATGGPGRGSVKPKDAVLVGPPLPVAMEVQSMGESTGWRVAKIAHHATVDQAFEGWAQPRRPEAA